MKTPDNGPIIELPFDPPSATRVLLDFLHETGDKLLKRGIKLGAKMEIGHNMLTLSDHEGPIGTEAIDLVITEARAMGIRVMTPQVTHSETHIVSPSESTERI